MSVSFKTISTCPERINVTLATAHSMITQRIKTFSERLNDDDSLFTVQFPSSSVLYKDEKHIRLILNKNNIALEKATLKKNVQGLMFIKSTYVNGFAKNDPLIFRIIYFASKLGIAISIHETREVKYYCDTYIPILVKSPEKKLERIDQRELKSFDPQEETNADVLESSNIPLVSEIKITQRECKDESDEINVDDLEFLNNPRTSEIKIVEREREPVDQIQFATYLELPTIYV